MRIHFLITFLLLLSNIFAQNDKKHLNFIINIDEKLPIGKISNPHIIVYAKENEIDTILIDCIPGELILSTNDYNKLISIRTEEIILFFTFTEVKKRGRMKFYDYEIILNKEWLEYSFISLDIYNLDKRKYKKIYRAPEEKKYSYKFVFPGYIVSPIKKN